MKRIYLDNQATTPIDPKVLSAMEPWLKDKFGNAASRNHPYGWEAEEAVEISRENVAGIIGAIPKEIIFTSGATEANNIALQGAARFYTEKGRHIITLKTEHKAVLDICEYLDCEHNKLTILPLLPMCMFLNCRKNDISGLPEMLKLIRLEYGENTNTAVLMITPKETADIEELSKGLINLDKNLTVSFYEAKANW